MKTSVKITGNWNDLKKQIQSKFPNLTDADLNFEPGKESELVSRISKKTGKSEDEVADAIDDLQSRSTTASSSKKETTKNY